MIQTYWLWLHGLHGPWYQIQERDNGFNIQSIWFETLWDMGTGRPSLNWTEPDHETPCFNETRKGIHLFICHMGWWSPMPWWRQQIETFPALLAICAGNSPVPGEFPAQRPVTQSFDVFFDLRLNKRLSKQSWGWWFETLSRPCVTLFIPLWTTMLLFIFVNIKSADDMATQWV